MTPERKVVSSLLFVFVISAFCFSQSSDTSTLYDTGVMMLRNGSYEQARLEFIKLISHPEPNPRLTSGYFLLAKTCLHLDKNIETASYAQKLINDFPDSRYRAHAHYLIACSKYNLNLLNEAMVHLAFAVEYSNEEQFDQYCNEFASVLTSYEVNPAKLHVFYDTYPWTRAKSYLALWIAQSYYYGGESKKGLAVLEDMEENNITEDAIAQKRQLREKLIRLVPVVKIGIILPLSGLFTAEANDMLTGIGFALSERKIQRTQIELYVEDSKGTTVGTVQSTFDLLGHNMTLLFGELEGNKSATIAGLTSQNNVPLIVPVATDNGIASIGKFIFQANNNLEIRGATLAEYAFNYLKMRTFATMAPADDYGYALTDAFTQKIDQLGGQIISQQWYYPGTQDVGKQFDAIRLAGFRTSVRDSLRAIGLSSETLTVDSIITRRDLYLKSETEDNTGLIDTRDIPVTSVDGFFMPIYEEDISFIVPQFALSNIQARLLGADYWNNLEILRKQRRYVNGVVFASGNYISDIDILYRNFENKYRVATKRSPGIMSVYGYNVMNVLLQAIDSGNVTRESIVEYLNSMPNYSGIGGEISFVNGGRVNTAVNILEFRDGNLRLIK
ncbi:penicillin-binding protein activator [candidate division KSB1 bacterium]|nr:penicillin-binding protein activator [candidate division KSB1 bacterium]